MEDLATPLGNTEEFLETLQGIEKERRIGNKSQQHNMMNVLIVSKVCKILTLVLPDFLYGSYELLCCGPHLNNKGSKMSANVSSS